MPGKAKQYVVQGRLTVQAALYALQEACTSAEKPENKAKIQKSINSLNVATQQLSEFKTNI